jgi:hypothetical protein
MVAEDTFANLQDAPVDALVTSKKWMRANTRFGFAQEIYDSAGHLVAVHEKFPVDLGHKRQ